MNLVPKIVDETFENKWVDGLTNEQYHADRTAISSTGLRSVLKSPRNFFRRFVLGMDDEGQQSKAMRLGSIVHLAALEPERFRYLYKIQPDFGDLRSSKNRDKRDEWLGDQSKDAVILTMDDYNRTMRMIESVMAYNGGMIVQMLKKCVFEKSGYFRDPVTGLKCRFRPDVLREDLTVMPDLKTSRDASRDFFSKEVWLREYHIQMAFYNMGVKAIHGKEPESPCFIVVQNCEPFEVAVYECSMGMMSLGEQQVRLGLNKLKKCIETDEWPGIQPFGAETLDLPAWTDNALEEM